MQEVTGSSPVSPIFINTCNRKSCKDFLLWLFYLSELIVFYFMQYLCSLELSRTPSAPLLVSICDQHVQFFLIENEVPCDLFRV